MDEKQGEFRQDYGQSQRLERGTIEDQRHLRQSSSQSCLVKATNGFVSGTVLGATMSGLTGMARATQMQIRFPAAVQAVIGATIVGGLSFGVALGTYQAAVCTIRHVRGVDDIKNPMLAGALVGAMCEIPVFLRSMVVTKSDVLLAEQGMHVMRPRPRFLTNAVGGAVICGLFYTVGDAMRPAPLPKPQGSPHPLKHPQDTLSKEKNLRRRIPWKARRIVTPVSGYLLIHPVERCWKVRILDGVQNSLR